MVNNRRKGKRSQKRHLHITDVDDPTKHNYWPKFQEISKKIIGKVGVHDIDIRHDDWCALLTGVGTYCDCDPIVKLRKKFL